MPRENNQVYVIGHINPDTDSIASALGYAWLLRDTTGNDSYVAARAGQLNPQTTWVLKRLEIEPPVLLPDASPRFENISHRLNTTTPDQPLREAWGIAHRTGGVAPVLTGDGSPYGLITVFSLFKFLSETIGSHPRREETKIAELFDRPCSEACDTDIPRFQSGSRVKDMLPRIMREERSEFWVVDKSGAYAGICRQRDALHPPRLRVILVDHNEPAQALGALDEADLLEILDHHRLGNAPTRMPIRFTVDPVGSTSTLVAERIDEAGLSAPPPLAGLLLAGLISDTLLLTSPTTTDRDRQMASRLSRWAFMSGSILADETLESYGRQILEAGSDLAIREPVEIVSADLKLYEAGGLQFGISQVEVTNFGQLNDKLTELNDAISALADSRGLDFVILMVTNVVSGSSRLLFTHDVPMLDVLPYPRRPDGTRSADGVVSRKKQLLPLVLGALEA
ncbi:MAG: DHH family phosphoesterase [Caldilineales bacterium]|nr:DHH family phosphoesterase [Caldilineales bacterium]